jgi:hypothetical protein
MEIRNDCAGCCAIDKSIPDSRLGSLEDFKNAARNTLKRYLKDKYGHCEFEYEEGSMRLSGRDNFVVAAYPLGEKEV